MKRSVSCLTVATIASFSASYSASVEGEPAGVLGAGVVGALLGTVHGILCGKPRVNDIALGIAMMLLGVGLAFYLGKPLAGDRR